MKLPSNVGAVFGKNELRTIGVLALLIWLKVYMVDFRIADILNWPLFDGIENHIIRNGSRALAVGLPSLAAILCVIIPVSMLPIRHRGRLLLVSDILMSVLALMDTMYIRYYSDIFVFNDVVLISQVGQISKSIWALLRPCDLLLFIDIPVIIFLKFKKKIRISFAPLTWHRIAISIAVLLLAVGIQLLTEWHLAVNRPNIINAMYDRLSVCAWTGVETFHWHDVLSLARTMLKSDNVPDSKIREISEWFSQHDTVIHKPLARGRNLIMIQCESLQYFVVDLRINGEEVTPNLNRFIKECVYFKNAWNQTAGGQSSDAEFMANTGFFPASYGAAYTRFDNNSYNSLARNLRAKGYYAAAFQGTYSAFWNCNRMHQKLSFEKDYSRNTFPNDEVIGLGLSDKAIFTETLKTIVHFKTPFYAFIITLSSHHPFDFKGLDDGTLHLPQELRGTLIGNYLISIHYWDSEFGRFIEGLRMDKLIDKSLIVVYGDHPAIQIAYKDEMEKLLGMKIEHPVDWKKTRRIPLIFRIPGNGQRITGTSDVDTGQMDILPTVSGLMGLDIQTVFGKDLFSEDGKEPVVFRNGSYIINKVFVEPAVGRATNIATGEKMDAAKFAPFTEDAMQRLSYSDLILEHNLIRKIMRRKLQEH